MTNIEYQLAAHAFAQYRDNLYPIVGLCEECGEAAGKIAKHLRKVGKLNVDAPDAPFAEALKKEIGDVLWFVSEICTTYGWDIGEVMAENIAKLTDRQARGVIVGEGDER